MKKWPEALDTVFLGLDCAVVLATVAFVVHKLGWNAFPVVFLPLFSAHQVGRRLAINKWMRDMDAKNAEIENKTGKP